MPGPIFLEGDRVSLHVVSPDDHEFLVRHWNDMPVRYQSGWPQHPLTEARVTEWIEDDETVQFLPCIDGEPIGHVSFSPLDLENRNGELGYMIVPDAEGQGYATEAGSLALDHAFDELGLHRVYARVAEHNEGSMRVLEKLGFQKEGVHREHLYSYGDYVDMHRFGLLRDER